MGIELTQWTVVRSRGATGEDDDASGVITLRSPGGETQPIRLDGLPRLVRDELRDLGSGSKLPGWLLRAVLRPGLSQASVLGDFTAQPPGCEEIET